MQVGDGLADRGAHPRVDRVGGVDVHPEQLAGRGPDLLQVTQVSVGLTEAGQSLVGDDLDDRAQCPRFVHAAALSRGGSRKATG
ncbi:hypothetical protein ACFQX6_28435 [Streptosporangium lutulentum]